MYMNLFQTQIAYAASTVEETIGNITSNIIQPIIGFFFALALAMFFWGIVQFIANAENEEKLSEGKEHMLWGIVGMFIMVSVFGIMNLICNTIGAC
jgi:hypothetical protein